MGTAGIAEGELCERRLCWGGAALMAVCLRMSPEEMNAQAHNIAWV